VADEGHARQARLVAIYRVEDGLIVHERLLR
jgi:hypothetical protein